MIGMPKGYVPLAHSVFDRIVQRMGMPAMAAALTPAPDTLAAPAKTLLDATGIPDECFSFDRLEIDEKSRSYRHIWSSNFMALDERRKPIARASRIETLSPWQPTPYASLTTKHPDHVWQLLRLAGDFWIGESSRELAEIERANLPFFGRIGSRDAAFSEIGADIWRDVAITNWDVGQAAIDDGTLSIFSIHGAAPGRKAAKTGRPKMSGEIVSALRALRPNGDYRDHANLKPDVENRIGRRIGQSTFTNAVREARETDATFE